MPVGEEGSGWSGDSSTVQVVHLLWFGLHFDHFILEVILTNFVFSGILTKVKSIGGHTALVVAMEWKRELVVKVFFDHLLPPSSTFFHLLPHNPRFLFLTNLACRSNLIQTPELAPPGNSAVFQAEERGRLPVGG